MTKVISSFLSEIAKNVPFYTNHSGDLRSGDLSNFPFIDKQQIVNNYDDFINTRYKNFSIITEGDYLAKKKLFKTKDILISTFTSGTSGYPFLILKTKEDFFNQNMVLWRNRKAINVKLNPENLFLFYRYNYQFKDLINDLDLFDESDENVSRVLSVLKNRIKPLGLYIKSSTLENYCNYIEKNNFSLDGWSLEYIENNSEHLSPILVEKARRIFHCKVINGYGLMETGNVAFDCSCSNLHINKNIIIEIFDWEKGIPIQEYCTRGEIVITSLIHKAMPLVRYRTGDIGWVSPTSCGCGKDGNILHIEEGRRINYLTCINGNLRLNGIELFHRCFSNANKKSLNTYIVWYKVIQYETSRFTFYYRCTYGDIGEDFKGIFYTSATELIGHNILIEFQKIHENDDVFKSQKKYTFLNLSGTKNGHI
jgi:phenylacetate-CoA ligase